MTIDDEEREAVREGAQKLTDFAHRLYVERNELRAEVERLRMLNERIAHDEMLVQMANDDLRAALAAVPTSAISAIVDSVPVDNWTRKPLASVKKWLKAQQVPA